MSTDRPRVHALQLPRDVLLISTADWDHPFPTNKQHVARGLAAAGFRVLYVESLGLRRPKATSRDLARLARRAARARRVRQVADNLWVASPLVLPWHDRPLVRRVNNRLLAAWLRRQMDQLGFERPIFWTYNPLAAPWELAPEAAMTVYHCVDNLAAAPGLPSAAISAAECELARRADVIFATSLDLHGRMARLNPAAAYYLPNVADFDHFSQALAPGELPSELAAIPRPRIGFVGAISGYKVDIDLIARVASERPHWQWVLIGQVGEGEPGTRIDALRLPNIHLLGPRPYERLPEYLRGFDVATIPAAAGDYTRGMFPLKFFEYLAAGLPVVAVNTPALAPYAVACKLVDSQGACIAAIERVLTGDRPDREDCLRLARHHTWQRRMAEMVRILEQAWCVRTDILSARAG